MHKVEIARKLHLRKRSPWDVVEVEMGGDTHSLVSEVA